ncbi:hypothetical protein ACUULL_003665 [Vibrio cholerae]|uniref:DUF1145 domain-containing protein n=4 Tax=Vibrio TaxID=662 RepID=A0ABR4RTQ9_VIBMT|nr:MULTISPECIES: hypothetical protein [Vibrio]AQP37196.1 hypothetical protein AA909_12960 [Vibrio anguillarum]EGQ7642200.1 hypothetical protein [Vibrio cholerae]EGQ8391407.1 hypothetical protein [Vibrio cholerae]EGQ9967422.1 hypothetical protein [Vibrio cholerae]EGR0311288.1 hypothetical protein [Vibrio cholerae]
MDRIDKYAGISFWGVFIIAAFIKVLSLDVMIINLLKTLVILALVHMLLYSFYVSFTAKKTSHKIGLTAFSIVFPIASGFMLYFFKQVLKIGAR